MRLWMSAALCVAMTGCIQENESAGANDPEPDSGVQVDGAVDVDASTDVDAAPDPAADDAGEAPDPCATACERFAECSVDECPGYEEDDADGLRSGCAEACAANPAFAAVVDGAASCLTVVDFGRDQGGEDYAAACRPEREPDPEDPMSCPWPCEEGETCRAGSCVRDDGTCDTDYHCRFGQEVCVDGLCEPAQFAECRGPADCADHMECRNFSQDPLAPGTCIIPCETDEVCPNNEVCRADFGNFCFFLNCGPGAGNNNGEIYGACEIGGRDGVCYPQALGNATPMGEIGVCLEGGNAGPGEPCDSQALGRTEEDLALKCDAGLICFGDQDNPRMPGEVLDSLGTCQTLCDPRQESPCDEGFACLDFTSPDNPATPNFDETTPIGLCAPSDCNVLGGPGQCEEGQECRLYSVLSDAGICAESGDTPPGEACADQSECAGVAICGNNGQMEQACVGVCEPGADDACPDGEICFATDESWVIGFCIPGG